VLPVDPHLSQARCTVEVESIRLGFNYVKGLPEKRVERILAGRAEKPFTSLADFCKRVRPGRQAAENLIVAGAMDGWGLPRRQLLWELGALHLQDEALDLEFAAEEVELPALSPAEAMLGEQSVLGLSPGDHVMTLFRPWLAEQGIEGYAGLAGRANGQRVRVAGLVVVHQSPPTAKGFHFITLEDEDGLMNVIINPQVYAHYQRVLRTARLLLFDGQVQREGEVINVLATAVRAFED
jgi:error-prone DNA polymerase